MQGNFKYVGLSFKNTPVEIREVIALDDQLMSELIETLKETLEISDILVLSTCNRTEIYYGSSSDLSQEIIKILGLKKGLNDILAYKDYFRVIDNADEASQQLFRVAMGLEAQVIGDLQIINQVKRAYQLSADRQVAGPFLHRILHTIFFANKRVFIETNFRNGAASVSYASAELIRSIDQNIKDPKILVLGLGEIGEDVARHLSDDQANITLANRSFDKAMQLAIELNLAAKSFEDALENISDFDIIVSSIPVKHLINKQHFAKKKDHALHFVIDLSIPRSVDPAIEDISGVGLYNIDEIQSNTSAALDKRMAAIPKVEAIISESVTDLSDWSMEMEVSPTIQKLKNALEDIRQEELKRHLKNASPEMEQMAEKLSKSLTQKIIKLPVLQLKAACKRGEAETLIDILNDLFDLENQPVKK